MERVKNLKVPPMSRNRSNSIDMIVMDEISKHGTLTTWNQSLNNVENTEYLNNTNNNNLSNSSPGTPRNNITPPLSPNTSGIFENNLTRNNRSNSTNNFNFNFNNNNNNNNQQQPQTPQPSFSLNFSNLSTPHRESFSNSPPVSPRGGLNIMNTAPNLSSLIAQHTPPPSPRLDSGGGSTKSLASLGSSALIPPFNMVSQGATPSTPISSSLPGTPLHNSGGLYRNLSFGQKMNSLQSLDMALLKSPSLNQSTGIHNGADNMSTLSASDKNLIMNNSINNNDAHIGVDDTPNTPHSPGRKKKKKESKSVKRMKRFISRILQSPIWTLLMTLCILYIIFIDDLIGISGSPSSHIQNLIITIVKLFVMVFFAVDMIGNLICFKPQYFPRTIVFWLDLWSLLSILPDIIVYFADYDPLGTDYSVLSIGKSARIIRLVGCFLQVSAITVVYKNFFRRQGKVPLTSDELEIEASKLGDKLIRLTTNKLVLLVLLVYFAGQLLTMDSTLPDQLVTSLVQSLTYISSQFGGVNSSEFKNYLSQLLLNNQNILYLALDGQDLYNNQNLIDSYQPNSQFKFNFNNSILIFNNQENYFHKCLFHLIFTVFTILIIMIINLFIVIDAYGLVINPLENVLAIVKFLSRQNAVMQKNSIIKTATRDRGDSVGTKSEDTTSSSLEDIEDPDEADYLLGMLNDIDDSLQAAKEKVEVEATQNSILKKDIEDLYVEKYILQIHLRSIMRKAELDDSIGYYLKKKQLALLSDTSPFSDDIRFKEQVGSDQLVVSSGTLDALVDRLTATESNDLKFANIFLFTFRKFMTPIELMERLIIRFCATPTMELPERDLGSNETVELWRKTKQEQIRVSVFNTIKLWIGKCYWDFYDNQELLELFNNLVQRIMPFCKMDRYSNHLETFLKRKMSSYSPDPEFTPLRALTSEEIAQMMVMEDKLLFNFEIHDVAVQITLIEFELFRSIKPQEFLDLAWTSKTKTKRSPNICKFIDHFNNVSFYLQTILVKSGRVKDRVSVLKKIISLGESFVTLNNFYGAMEVLSSLESSAIARLHKTWENLPASSLQSLQALQKLLSPMGSFKEYRDKLRQAQSACIPYIGVFLSDLTFIQEGNPDYRDGNLINFSKQKDIASIIISIQQYQNTYYYYESNEKIKSQINLRGIDAESIWKMSLTAEPRRKD